MRMPRSQIKKISDMIDLIKSDELLQRKFADLMLHAIEHDMSLRRKMSEIVGREFADGMRGI